MSPSIPTIDDAYRQYAELLLRRHRLLLQSKDKDPQTEEIEDQLTEVWEKLDDIQRHSLSGIGSDLNWIRRRTKPPPRGRKQNDVTQQEIHELLAKKASNDWHGVLFSLRVCAPVISPEKLAYLRASAYDAIGFYHFASTFYDLAAEIEPGNSSIAVLALRAVELSDPDTAQMRAAQILDAPLRYPCVAVLLSAVMVLREKERKRAPIDKERFAGILRGSIERLPLEPPSEATNVMVYHQAAIGFEVVEDFPSALQCYEDGLKFAPDHDGLLVGKGLLLYGSDSAKAVEAFGRAVRNGTPLLWPYFFLAHQYLLNGQFALSLGHGGEACKRAISDPVRAELLEWAAICQCELSFPEEAVRLLFQKAVALDPSNARIARNFGAFEAAKAQEGQAAWEIEKEQALKVRRAPRSLPIAA